MLRQNSGSLLTNLSGVDLYTLADTLDYLTEALTLTDVGYGIVFTLDYIRDVDYPNVYMTAIDGADYEAWLTRMGYASSFEFQYTLLYRELADRERIAYIQSHIANNADYETLAAAVDADITEIDDLSKTDGDADHALYAQIRDLYEQMDSLSNEINIVKKSIDSVDFEIDKICPDTWANTIPQKDDYYSMYYVSDGDYSQIAILFRDFNRLTEKMILLEQFMNAEDGVYYTLYDNYGSVQYSFNFGEMTMTVWDASSSYTSDFTIEEFIAIYTNVKQVEVEIAQSNLTSAQERLARLEVNGEPLAQVIEDLTLALDRAQAEYDAKLEIYTLWSDRLNAMLELLAGTSENPEA